jgi:hypothetical protein
MSIFLEIVIVMMLLIDIVVNIVLFDFLTTLSGEMKAKDIFTLNE